MLVFHTLVSSQGFLGGVLCPPGNVVIGSSVVAFTLELSRSWIHHIHVSTSSFTEFPPQMTNKQTNARASPTEVRDHARAQNSNQRTFECKCNGIKGILALGRAIRKYNVPIIKKEFLHTVRRSACMCSVELKFSGLFFVKTSRYNAI